ncbi:MAG: hypothetical protein ACXACY_26605 [Candidatus Hodarchaeales archaeon]|jgi:hypothetical protein
MNDNVPYPVIAIYANDWAGYPEEFPINIIDDISPLKGWVVGMLLKETADFVTIGQEFYPENKTCRWVTCINKAAIIKRINFETEGREE